MKISSINIRHRKFIYFLALLLTLLILGFTMPKNLEKKVKKHILKTFEVESFQLDTIAIPKNTSIRIITSDNFNSINTKNTLIGYVLVDKAKSKAYDFDYMVLFNQKLKIITIKILIYREEHGNEISSKRWLKQFFGLGAKDKAILQYNIDGISGATISVRSMTTEMNNLLLDLNLLEKMNILPIK